MDLSKFTNACVKCGKCIPQCTIHSINADESTSPRGFLDLISAVKSGDLPYDKNAKKIFESCFLCTNCVEACPSHIRVDTAIEAIRFEMANKLGITWYKRLAFWLLSHRKVLDIVAKFGFVFQSCAFKIQGVELEKGLDTDSNLLLSLAKNSNLNEKNSKNLDKNQSQNCEIDSSENYGKNYGMKAKFSLPLVKKGRLLMSLSSKSFLNEMPEFIDNGGDKTIGFFVGCLSNYSYTNQAKSVIEICKALKINVDLMKAQSCCGAPQYFTGAFNSVEKLAKKNIEYFEKKLEKCEFIITPEATCSAMLNVDYEHFFELKEDKEWANRAKLISKKIKLATKYFCDETKLLELLKSKGKSELLITYHDPCHARKMQGVFKEPRELLKVNYRFVELKDSNACCGFGGVSMQMDYYENALKVGLRKANDINESKAQIISAECSACRMQISNALEQSKSKTIFLNPLELVASALK